MAAARCMLGRGNAAHALALAEGGIAVDGECPKPGTSYDALARVAVHRALENDMGREVADKAP